MDVLGRADSNSKRKVLRQKAAQDETGLTFATNHKNGMPRIDWVSMRESTKIAEPPNNRVMLRPAFGRSTLRLPMTF